MTQGSLTEMQPMLSTPFAFNASAFRKMLRRAGLRKSAGHGEQGDGLAGKNFFSRNYAGTVFGHDTNIHDRRLVIF